MDGALLAAMDKVARRPRLARVLNAVLGLVLAPLILLGIVGWRALPLVPERQGPGLPRRPVDPHAGPAARASRRRPAPPSATARSRAAPSRRPASTSRPAAGSRSRPSRSEALFGGDAGHRHLHRRRAAGGPRRSRRASRASAAGRWTTRPSSSCGRLRRHRRRRRLHRARRHPQARQGRGRASTRASRSTSSGRAGSARRRARSRGRWACRGILVFVAGIVALILGFNLPSSGIVLVGIALIVAADLRCS